MNRVSLGKSKHTCRDGAVDIQIGMQASQPMREPGCLMITASMKTVMLGFSAIVDQMPRRGALKIISSGKAVTEIPAEVIDQQDMLMFTKRTGIQIHKSTLRGRHRATPLLTAIMKTTITNIADIQLGYQFRKKIEPVEDGTHWVVQIRDFDQDLALQKDGLLRVYIDKPADSFLINKGDVLFLSRGQRNWAVAITDDLKDTITVSHFFVIKIKNSHILPEYLSWYINQAPAQEYLHTNARRGTHMPLIPLSAFAGLTVEVPDVETQKMIVELSKLMEKEKRLLNELQIKRSLLVSAISLKAIKNKKEK